VVIAATLERAVIVGIQAILEHRVIPAIAELDLAATAVTPERVVTPATAAIRVILV